MCRLRSLQPLDRSISSDTAAEKCSQAAATCRQLFKKLRFQMIANTSLPTDSRTRFDPSRQSE
jgi:hypothetical protein